jgi:hypothetical protein
MMQQQRARPTYRPARGQNRGGASLDGLSRRWRIPLPHLDRRGDRKGTLICHARLHPGAPAILALAVPMIEPTLRAQRVPAIGTPPLLAAALIPAGRAAIALGAIAVLTDPEHRVALPAAANPLPENRFAVIRHPRRQTGVDNGSQSWQGQDTQSMVTCFLVADRNSAASDGGVPLSYPPTRSNITPSTIRSDDVRLRRR